jgi:PAS domain S-box-containing protein
LTASERHEPHYKLFFEASPEGMLMVSEDGTLLDANPRACDLLGYGREELLQIGIREVIDPFDARFEANLWEKSVREGGTREIRLLRRDGTAFLAEFWLTVPSDAENDGLIGVVFRRKKTIRRVRTEEALNRNDGWLAALIENASGVITILDTDGTVRYENPAAEQALGYLSKERIGHDFLKYVHPDDEQRVRYALLQDAADGTGGSVEFRLRHADGSWRCLEGKAESLPDFWGGGIIISSHDITERKTAEENLRRSLGVLLALREAGQILGSTLETEEIVTRLLKIMRGVSGLTAAVISVEVEHGQTRIWRAVGLDGLWARARYAPEAEEARRFVLDNGKHRLFWLRSPNAERSHLAGLCLPLRMRERVAGVLEAYGPESLAENDAVEILRSLAAQAASALENARLYGQLAEREKRLADLIGQLLTAQEEERRHVAYEVHDGLAQIAAAAHQHLQAFNRYYPPDSEEGQELLLQTLRLVQRTVGEARRVIADLRPTALDDFGLRTAIRLEAEELRANGWQVDYSSNLGDDERLPVAVETALFRVAQEALTNARKHARAKRARLALNRLGHKVRLRVRDWGQGFDPEAHAGAGGPGERVGISSMRERVDLLGGDFRIRSSPHAGTLVMVEVPRWEGQHGANETLPRVVEKINDPPDRVGKDDV